MFCKSLGIQVKPINNQLVLRASMFGVVDVSARPAFLCSQCTGEVDICGTSGIVARRHI